MTVALRHERLAEALVLFEGLTRRLDELYADYSDDDLAIILDFMQRSAAAQRAATEELTRRA